MDAIQFLFLMEQLFVRHFTMGKVFARMTGIQNACHKTKISLVISFVQRIKLPHSHKVAS